MQWLEHSDIGWVKVDEEIFDYVGKRISEGDTALYGRVTYQIVTVDIKDKLKLNLLTTRQFTCG